MDNNHEIAFLSLSAVVLFFCWLALLILAYLFFSIAAPIVGFVAIGWSIFGGTAFVWVCMELQRELNRAKR